MLIRVSIDSTEERKIAIYNTGLVSEELAIGQAVRDAMSKILAENHEWVYYEKDNLWLLIDRSDWKDYEDPLGAARDSDRVLLMSADIIEPGHFYDNS